MQIYEYIQHPCTTLRLAARDVVLHQLMGGANTAAGRASDGAGTGVAAGAAGTAEA